VLFLQKWGVPALILDVLLLAAIITQAIIYSKQLHQMRRSTDAATHATKAATTSVNIAKETLTHAKQTSALDLRAWVAANVITGVPSADSPYQVSISVINSGRTFAKNVHMIAMIEIVKPDQQIPNFDIVEEAYQTAAITATTGLLATNQELKVDIDVKKGDANILSADDITSVQTRQTWLFAHGNVSYVDIFKCKHWTKFCWFLSPAMKWVNYQEHNDADDSQCP